MDFTLESYKLLLNSLIKAEFNFQTFDKFLQDSKYKSVILRHDVDLLPQNSLRFAKIQAELGIRGSYYFRAVPESWDERIIKEIADLGHEVGYHYENMDAVYQKIKGKSDVLSLSKGKKTKEENVSGLPLGSRKSRSDEVYGQLIDLAYEDFCINLDKLRKLVPVNTICMHGSPRSQFDNKAIWDKYNYQDLGIIGEPYYDVDFDEVFYLTDTGRRWDGWKTSVRDKVPQQEGWIKKGLVFHSTQDIINAIHADYQFSNKLKSIPFSDHPLGRGKDVKRNGFFNQTPNTEHQTLNTKQQMPSKIMFTMHPQRWHDSTLSWVKELLMQNIKNQVKKVLFVK